MDEQRVSKQTDKLILVTGSDGIVGSGFVKTSEFKNSFHTPRSVELNITDKTEIKAVLSSYDFGVIVNFAAETSTVEAEKERGDIEGKFWQTNVEGVRNLTEAVRQVKPEIRFIQISTSKVFSGDKKDKGPYDEKHPTQKDVNRLSWYGYTKKCAEDIVKENIKDNATIIRLCHVVNPKSDKEHEFLNKLLDWYEKDGPVFNDQYLTITDVDDAVKVIDMVIKKNLSGIFHVSSTDTTTPFELIKYLIQKLGNNIGDINSTSISDFRKKSHVPEYVYPKYGGLKVQETEKILDIKFKTWRETAEIYVKQKLQGKQ